MLVAISKSKATDKSWTIDGTIKFTLAEVHSVKSVFDPLDKVLGK